MKSKKPATTLLDLITTDFEIDRGHPMPLGASLRRNGINFSVLSKHAKNLTLVLYASGGYEPIAEFPLNPKYHQTGHVWHIFIKGMDPGIRYGYRVDQDLNEPVPENGTKLLLDPYAKAFSGAPTWGKVYVRRGVSVQKPVKNNRRALVVDDEFDWEFDQPLNIPLANSIIYELHVRGYTKHKSAKVEYPGTFLGLTEKIPYLKDLGVTAVELLPINEFEEIEGRDHSETGEPLLNFWGYNSIGFFAPKSSFAFKSTDGGQVKEFKSMVKAFHKDGIEVILDIVFNHTAEGNEKGPVYNFKGLDENIYYIKDPQNGSYMNYSGCGNTLNCNHPVVRDMILDCLKYWVTEMHVDGFRFDLASILGRGQDGAVLSNPPLLERIAYDPILANTKIIAEAWDAAGLYQVGTFPAWKRWAEWNGQFRDDLRCFEKSDPGMVSRLAARLTGSPDLYEDDGREPFHSINFITSHDGFPLADLVSYNSKHNEANGESNADGSNENYSWNCGHEGPTSSEEINKLRIKQQKNMAALLLLSHGVPMILGGDEFGRTQKGNNNAYCQDNEISWVDWNLTRTNTELLRFFKLLIQFRKSHPNLRPISYKRHKTAPGPLITWHGVKSNRPDFSFHSRSLALQLHDNPDDNDLFIIVNAFWETLVFRLPKLKDQRQWVRVIDTSLKAPNDICQLGKEKIMSNQNDYKTSARSVVVFLAR